MHLVSGRKTHGQRFADRACARPGYVPAEAPGAMGYYTPRTSIVQSREALGLARSSLRNPVRPSRPRQASISRRAGAGSRRAIITLAALW